MERPWLSMWVIAGISLVTVLIVLATPDNLVPAVTNDPAFDHVEAVRTLDEVRERLAANPMLGVDDLQPEFPLLAAVERKEPAGVLWAALALGVGLLGTLALVRSGNRFGRYLQWVGLTAALFGLARAVADFSVHSATAVPLRQLWLALADTLWIPLGVILAPLLILVFPNGRPVSPLWRWVPRVAAVAAVVLLSQLVHPARYDGRALGPDLGIDLGLAGLVFTLGLALWLVALVAASVSLLIRFRRATGEERLQLTWVAWGIGVAVIALAASTIAEALGGDPTVWGPVSQAGFFVVLPVTVLVTIFRYRLYDIDLVVHKSVVYLALTLIVAAAYAVTVVIVSRILPDIALVPGLLAVTVAALMFEPARLRLVEVVDRLVYRRMAEPYDALAGLAVDLGNSYDLEEGLSAMARAAAAGTGASYVAVWVRVRDRVALVATYPPGVGAPAEPTFDGLSHVVAIGEVGFLGIQMARGETLRATEAVLLDDLAAAAQQFVENVRLRRGLKERVGELEMRRAELLEVQERLDAVVDRARGELERDLHDGAQARAVSLSAAIGLARAQHDTRSVDALLAAVDDAETATRHFARGLYPTDLATAGLVPALRRTLPVELGPVSITSRGRPASAEVETALFYVALEAVQNAAKHAPGSEVTVEYAAGDDDVVLTVADDGPGFDTARDHEGRGLHSMRTRVEALGGDLRVRSHPTAGTKVIATFSGARP